jgi:DNA-binding PucR family transcriptional regulator
VRRRAAVGPAVSWREAGRSLRLARALLQVGARDSAAEEPRWVADHLLAIALDDVDGALGELRAARLAPLERLGDGARTRLQPTLLTWCQQQGNRAATARALGVHEQTVRYRMNQLRDLFGDALQDPDARFEIELSLRAAASR